MKTFPRRCGALLICLLGLPTVSAARLAAAPATFYLSPTGSDANSGATPEAPFASLTRVRDAIRALNSSGPAAGDTVVEVMKGDYFLDATVRFTDQDSGKNGSSVIYKNHDGIGSARFIGGTRVTGWTPYKDNIFQAKVGPGLEFTTLYENGVRADMARWPKRTSPFATSRAGYLTFLAKKGETLSLLDSARSPTRMPFDPAGKDFSNAWVYAWQGGDGHRWCSATTAVTAVNSKEISIKGCGLGWPPDNFLIEGSLGLLTQPGEFFYDKKDGILHYASRVRGPIEKQEIILPKIVRLIEISGDSGSSPAHDLRFSGLTFIGTDRIAQSSMDDWTDKQQSSWDASIYIKNSRNVVIQNCRVADAGINGITIGDGAQSCGVSGCLVEHVGYQGIDILGGSRNTVTNCLVRFCGELRGHGRGVNALADASILKNLEIYDVPRAGVCVGPNANVSYVKVHDCVQDSGDQGGFYICGNGNTTFDHCTSFHNYCDLTNMDRPPTAVYNDRDSPNVKWSNIDAGDSQMFIFRHDPQREGTLSFENVNWDPACDPKANETRNTPNPAFDRGRMEYAKIGLAPDFPREYRDVDAVPATPGNVWVQTGNGQLTLHWTQVDHATSYTVSRATRGGKYAPVGNVVVPATGWDLGTTFTDAGLTNNTAYFYIINATNAAGTGAATPEVKATPSTKGSNKLAGNVIGTGGNAALAFDGKLTTYFEAQNGWAGLDLGKPCVVTEVRYSPRSDNTDTTARLCGGEFQGANDPAFASPTTLFKVLGTKGGAGTPVLIPQGIFNPAAFRYVRYIGASGRSLVGEVEFYGYPTGP